MLENPATFTMRQAGKTMKLHGVLRRFEQLQSYTGLTFYRAVLVPRLWWLSLTHHNQVFLHKKVPAILEDVLKDGGLSQRDFEFKLGGSKGHPEWEYVCQYAETHLHFASRWMEREGMYYYFEQGDDHEKVIVTDTKVAHTALVHGKTLRYSPPSGLEAPYRQEVVSSFNASMRLMPRKVNVRDYNYENPWVDLEGEAEVDDHGRGMFYAYGDHFRNNDEGKRLAQVRAEALRCQQQRFAGKSTIAHMRPGYVFQLKDHDRKDFNQDYLIIRTRHRGQQAAYLKSGLGLGVSTSSQIPEYANEFEAIPVSVQYRPQRTTKRPSFHGTLPAKIDAQGSGQYAELDKHGRYKVKLPFDLSGRSEGRATHWIRMAQPYAGDKYGMHFPLHKGAEVLLTFVDGDPDRPIIAHAAPNPQNVSPVTMANFSQSRIKTAGGNQLEFEDKDGMQYLDAVSPPMESRLTLGYVAGVDKGTLASRGEKGVHVHTQGRVLSESEQDTLMRADKTVKISSGTDMVVDADKTLHLGVSSNKFSLNVADSGHFTRKVSGIYTESVGSVVSPKGGEDKWHAKGNSAFDTGVSKGAAVDGYSLNVGEGKYTQTIQATDGKTDIYTAGDYSVSAQNVSMTSRGECSWFKFAKDYGITMGATAEAKVAATADAFLGVKASLEASIALECNNTLKGSVYSSNKEVNLVDKLKGTLANDTATVAGSFSRVAGLHATLSAAGAMNIGGGASVFIVSGTIVKVTSPTVTVSGVVNLGGP